MQTGIFLTLFAVWATPIFAGTKDCSSAGRVLLKEGKFKISRGSDGAYLFASSAPPPHTNDQNFVAWSWVNEVLPTVQPDHLIKREHYNKRAISRDYREYLKSQGLPFPRKRQIPIVQVNQYRVKFFYRETPSELSLLIPVTPQGLPDTKLLAKIRRALRELPTSVLQKIDSIKLAPFPSLLPPKKGEVEAEIMEMVFPDTKRRPFVMLYPLSMYQSHSRLVHILRHELGHVMAYDFYGNYIPDSYWTEAMAADNAKVSNYGEESPAEDFAEAFRVYLEDENARLLLPHRFQILDEIFEAL